MLNEEASFVFGPLINLNEKRDRRQVASRQKGPLLISAHWTHRGADVIRLGNYYDHTRPPMGTLLSETCCRLSPRRVLRTRESPLGTPYKGPDRKLSGPLPLPVEARQASMKGLTHCIGLEGHFQ